MQTTSTGEYSAANICMLFRCLLIFYQRNLFYLIHETFARVLFFCFFAKWIYLTNLLCIQIAISRQTFGFCCGVVFVSLLFRIENACQCIWITHFLQALDVLIFFQDVTICASCGAFVRSFNAYRASVWCFINNE